MCSAIVAEFMCLFLNFNFKHLSNKSKYCSSVYFRKYTPDLAVPVQNIVWNQTTLSVIDIRANFVLWAVHESDHSKSYLIGIS